MLALLSTILGEASQRLGEAIRFEGTLPPQLRELAILTMATHWQAQYEWWAHEKVALEVGLELDIIAGIKAGTLPDSAEPAHHIVYGFAQELLAHRHTSDERYQEAVALLGESGVVELVILLGAELSISDRACPKLYEPLEISQGKKRGPCAVVIAADQVNGASNKGKRPRRLCSAASRMIVCQRSYFLSKAAAGRTILRWLITGTKWVTPNSVPFCKTHSNLSPFSAH